MEPVDQPTIQDSWTPSELGPQLEAILLMSQEPVDQLVLAEIVQAPEPVVAETLAELAEFYTTSGRGFQLRNVGGGWQLATRPEHHELLTRWVKEGQHNRLTQASLETLAVIAYLQPVSRSRVSAVRGVNVDSVVRNLLARELIVEDGEDEVTGAATLRTTDYFLARLGLTSLDDLPDIAPRLPEASELEAELASLTNPAPTAAESEEQDE